VAEAVRTVNDPTFQTTAAAAVAAVGATQVELAEAVVITLSPTSSPTASPTLSPTRPDACTLLTSDVFSSVAPSASAPYSHAGLCTAINNWNAANPDNQIFMDGTELVRKHEISAFLGNVLHESGDLVHPREITQCGTNVDVGGTLHCQPSGYTSNQGAYSDPYCSSSHSTTTTPKGCDCSAVDEVAGSGYEAKKLFFGRGPIQLSWNYNYIDAGSALDVNLCANPDLVATDEAVAWGTAIWFWMTQGSPTPHESVVIRGQFGGTLKAINGGNECPAASGFSSSVASRLDDYCRAATQLGVNVLLSFAGCDGLQAAFNTCVEGTSSSCSNCMVWEGVTLPPTSCEL